MFLLNSCLDLFSAPQGVTPEDPFSRSYGVNLPSSLTVSLSSASVLSHPTTCVGLRYGPVPCQTKVTDFLGSLLLGRCPSPRRGPVLSGLAHGVAAAVYGYLPSTRYSVSARAFRFSVSVPARLPRAAEY